MTLRVAVWSQYSVGKQHPSTSGTNSNALFFRRQEELRVRFRGASRARHFQINGAVELFLDTPDRLSMPRFNGVPFPKAFHPMAQVEIVMPAEISYLGPTHGERLQVLPHNYRDPPTENAG